MSPNRPRGDPGGVTARWARLWPAALSLTIWAAFGTATHAAFRQTLSGTSLPRTYTAAWDWDLANANESAGPAGGPNWSISLFSPASAPPKTLIITVQHLVAPDANEVTPNPGAPAVILAGAYSAGMKHNGALVVPHPNTDHFDIYDWNVLVPQSGPPGDVSVLAEHRALPGFPNWSYEPGEPKGAQGTLTVKASYATGDDRTVFDGKVTVDPAHPLGGSLQIAGETRRPTDYSVTYTVGDPLTSNTTMAFVVGNPGSLSKADLALMFDFFLGQKPLLTPALFDAKQVQNLYVGVDLTQWVAFGSPFSVGDQFAIVNGLSPDLPGFMVSMTPLTFDPALGYTTSTPWTGTAVVGGTIDGKVPEPGALALIALGLADLLIVSQGRRLRSLTAGANGRPPSGRGPAPRPGFP